MSTVFIDVDTQLDFLYPAGALYVPGAERLVPIIERLNRHAAAHGIPLLSTTDAHSENDPEFASWPPHCVAGYFGQRKPAATLLGKRVVIPNSDGPFSLAGAEQIILEKQTIDAFATSTIVRVLDALQADRSVVYGVVTEICVLCVARGLLARKKKVVVVQNAIQYLDQDKASQALDEIRRLGGELIPNISSL
ncbi:MAG: cysteine hydrolase [Acidobacteriia bacterium]|nr:cysteine hydrolase [Terriglobia bacterium]